MNLKLGPIQIFVSDIKKAEKWYSEKLGLRLIKKYPEFKCVLMSFNNIEFDIGTPNESWGQGWNKVKIGGRTNIFFETKNIENTVKELKERGVKFVEEISKRFWGEYKAVFTDSDNNEFNLIQVQQLL